MGAPAIANAQAPPLDAESAQLNCLASSNVLSLPSTIETGRDPGSVVTDCALAVALATDAHLRSLLADRLASISRALDGAPGEVGIKRLLDSLVANDKALEVAAPIPAGATLAVDDFAAVDTAAAAWMLKPSGDAYDALAAAVRAVLELNRPVPAIAPRSAVDVRNDLERLRTYPGDDFPVYMALDALRGMLPSIPAMVPSGSLLVGADIRPGRYKTIQAVEDCYWETLNEAAEINDNNFVNAAPAVIMTVRPGDVSVNTEGCGYWVKVG